MSEERAEDVIAKYKRLLNLAKTNLETNQRQLAEKDKQIVELVAALEEERSKRAVEFEAGDDEWKSFHDERGLSDFINRTPGAPLGIPPKCLSSEESARLVEDCKSKVERISEEFRRYKVKMEITLKQREAEHRVAPLTQALPSSSRASGASGGSNGNLPSALERALTHGNLTQPKIYSSDGDKLQAQWQEKEQKWRASYEKLARELEVLKTQGAESVVAAQWRQRYESCQRDKEDLQARLSLYTEISSEVLEKGRSPEQLLVELQEEYKALRRSLWELFQEFQTRQEQDPDSASDYLCREVTDLVEQYRVDPRDLDDGRLLLPRSTAAQSPRHGTDPLQPATMKGGMAESKVQYIRHMVFQYLVCREPEVRAHIEAALMTLFRFNEEERAAIQVKSQEETQDTITSITSFLGSFAS